MSLTIHVGDSLEILRTLPSDSVHCCVTSPPYWALRDYGVDGQIGLEASPAEFIAKLVAVFEEVRRVLRADGTCWINMGDSYANDGKWGGSTGGKHAKALHGDTGIGRNKVHTGMKPKDLMMMPHRLAIALQAAGWWVRQDIVWSKPNPMPESVRYRCTKAHEYIFLLTKSEQYFFDSAAMKEEAIGGAPGNLNPVKGSGLEKHRTREGAHLYAARAREALAAGEQLFRNRRSVWTVPTRPFKEAHFATFPLEIPTTCIKAGCPVGGVVLDPFFGAGTTGLAADRLQRDCIGIELNPEYAEMARRRIFSDATLFADIEVAA